MSNDTKPILSTSINQPRVYFGVFVYFLKGVLYFFKVVQEIRGYIPWIWIHPDGYGYNPKWIWI